MPSTTVSFPESDVVRLVLEFLANRDLNISMLSVERETGVINGIYSDDLLFLRQLILDGQWDDAVDFVQPLTAVTGFDSVHFRYAVYRHKYLELLCVRADAAPGSDVGTVDEVVRCLNDLESVSPSREEYNRLCLLLTTQRLSDHPEYAGWNPSSARVQCFSEIRPFVEHLLPAEKRGKADILVARDDRLVQLLVKGLLYESCVEFCQREATGSPQITCKTPALLSGAGLDDADVSLLSWLESVPHDIFACPFEQRSLRIDVQPLVRPQLEASWSEQILVAPIRPTTFPHSAISASRPRSMDMMSRSLNPQYDGLAHGLAGGRFGVSDNVRGVSSLDVMSRSFAGFHLNAGERCMNVSVDKLFEEGEIPTVNEVTRVQTVPALPTVSEIPIQVSATASQPLVKQADNKAHLASVDRHRVSGARGDILSPAGGDAVRDSSAELYREYQKQRQRVQDQLAEREKQRLVQQQQIIPPQHKSPVIEDNRVLDEADSRMKSEVIRNDVTNKGFQVVLLNFL